MQNYNEFLFYQNISRKKIKNLEKSLIWCVDWNDEFAEFLNNGKFRGKNAVLGLGMLKKHENIPTQYYIKEKGERRKETAKLMSVSE